MFVYTCLLYTSDAADERSSVDLGGRRIIKKKKNNKNEEGGREHSNKKSNKARKTWVSQKHKQTLK